LKQQKQPVAKLSLTIGYTLTTMPMKSAVLLLVWLLLLASCFLDSGFAQGNSCNKPFALAMPSAVTTTRGSSLRQRETTSAHKHWAQAARSLSDVDEEKSERRPLRWRLAHIFVLAVLIFVCFVGFIVLCLLCFGVFILFPVMLFRWALRLCSKHRPTQARDAPENVQAKQCESSNSATTATSQAPDLKGQVSQ
jgi:Flp pilus assembly protein TadB